MKKILCPSMMCSDIRNLEEEVKLLDEADIDIYHLDLMDGRFVPNFAMGLQEIEYICKSTSKKKELHMMIERPEDYISKFAEMGVDILFFHPESTYHASTVIQKIKDLGCEAGIVLSPGTSFEAVSQLLRIVDRVMVMAVNPGHAGQICLPYADDKIERLVRFRDEIDNKFLISIDGACSLERIKKLSAIGVESFVLGTAGLFYLDRPRDYKQSISELRAL